MKILAALLSLVAASSAFATDLDFVLSNDTGRDFEAIYISASADKTWNGNLLPDGKVLKPGEDYKVTFTKADSSATWDINVVDEAGLAVSFDDVNLVDVKKVTLKEADGQVTAVVE